MAIYKLTPLDSTDSVWRRFPFVETVWVNARDEHQARACVSSVAHRLNPDLVNSPNYWPWLFFARCTIDETHPGLVRDEVVDARGQRVGVVCAVSQAAPHPLIPAPPRKRGTGRVAESLLTLSTEGRAKRPTRGRSKRALH
jgi:hypothetical protein